MTPEKRDKLVIFINRIIIILIIIMSFFLGRYSLPIEREISAPFRIVDDKNIGEIQEMIDVIAQYDDLEVDNDLERLKKGEVITDFSEYSFVASSRGSKYYKIDSGSADKLSEKNRIYFRSEEDAEEDGYKKGF